MQPSDFETSSLPSGQDDRQEPADQDTIEHDAASEREPAADDSQDTGESDALSTREVHDQDTVERYIIHEEASSDITPPPFASQAVSAPPQRPRWWQGMRSAMMIAVLLAGLGVGLIAGKAFTATSRTSTTQTTTSATVTTASSSASTTTDLQNAIIAVVQQDEPSVVEVTSQSATETAIGTGEFLTANGYIVTNAHVVNGFSSFTVTLSDGTTQSAQLIGTDTQDDLAVLKTDVQNATPIVFADSSQEMVGDFVVALGSPLGLEESATFGIVSALNRTEQETLTSSTDRYSAGPVLTGLIQTSAQLNPGNSGGALVNLDGQLVGITTLGATSTSSGESVSGIGFAIPSNTVKTIVNEIIQSGSITSNS